MAQEQFFLMATRCCMGHRPLLFFITLLFTVLGSTAKERAKHAGDYFTLLRHLLNYAYNSNINLPNAEVLLNNEIDWLKRIRDEVKRSGETGVEETILEGHLGVTKELLAFQTPEKKFYIGCEKGGANLIKVNVRRLRVKRSRRLWGEPVNLREQHDALEFFNSLVDSLDEALKALGHPSMLSRILGGSFADQKICQGCPHRTCFAVICEQACDSVTMSDHLLRVVLNLLRREVSEHGRHLQQYFNLFVMYANLGLAEKTQLLKLSVPATFMLVALDEGPGPPIKYQYAELGKLYTVVSQLVRCCDVASRMQSSINGNPPLANPFADPSLTAPIMPLQQLVAETLFVRTSYVKKIIEDCSTSEETVKLLRFCCWENPQFSSTVLSELLWQVAYSYTYELRPYLDLLLQILLIEDSWQTHRIHNVLKGIPDDRDGLFDTIQRSKNHYQKRAYQCIKCMVALFTNCSVAHQILQSNGDLKRKWTWA
ncbi:probable ubiquitin carboxyl-terminal hydrolase FAF-X, partial [Sinocyclocheilus grahami]|uniref:probable ubiquitin carboxyl-terminal hydrolase FAF-X n=1 Tax=Sinocyclocheilus grahami TaxID=75366 RepID=UPI0007AD1429